MDNTNIAPCNVKLEKGKKKNSKQIKNNVISLNSEVNVF